MSLVKVTAKMCSSQDGTQVSGATILIPTLPRLLPDIAIECGWQYLRLGDELEDPRMLGNVEQFLTQTPAGAGR